MNRRERISAFLRDLPAATLSAASEVYVSMANVVIKDPNILGEEPVFRGTRVPFKALIDYLEGGDTLANSWNSIPA